MWRSRRWGDLLNLIDRLPRNSQFQEALANDEEYARQVTLHESQDTVEGAGEWRPPMSTYSAEAELLLLVANKIETLVATVDNALGGKGAPNYIKGPSTAIDEYRSTSYFERRQRKHESLVARLLPNKGESKPPVG